MLKKRQSLRDHCRSLSGRTRPAPIDYAEGETLFVNGGMWAYHLKPSLGNGQEPETEYPRVWCNNPVSTPEGGKLYTWGDSHSFVFPVKRMTRN